MTYAAVGEAPAAVTQPVSRASARDLCCVAATAALAYFVLRSTTDFVWNDTVGIYSLPPNALAGLPSLRDTLGSLSPNTNYRPLANFIASQAVIRVGTGMLNVHLWLALIALVVGAAAAAMFSVAMRLLGSRTWALLATVLYFCSPAFLVGSWVVLAGQQPVVPLLMCLGLLFYWRVRDRRGWSRAFNALGLGVVLLLGPWYREFLGVVSVLVVIEELRQARRPTPLMALSAAGFLHGLFPMLLPKLLINPALPIMPITGIGDVGVQLGAPPSAGEFTGILGMIRNLRWNAAIHFLDLLPPSLVLIALAGFVAKRREGISRVLRRESIPQTTTGIGSFVHVLLDNRVVLAVAILVLLPLGYYLRSALLLPVALWSFLALALFGFSVSPLLGMWFLLTTLPFFKVFTEIVHLSYPLVPGSIIVAAGLREAWNALGGLQGRLASCLRWGFSAAVVLLVLDQTLNPYAVWVVVQACNAGIQKVAATLEQRVPRGAVVVGNAIHLLDIEGYAKGWFQSYFTVRSGVSGPFVDDSAELAAVIAAHPGTTYLLDINQPYPPDRYAYHSHKYVRTHAVDWIDLGSLYTTRVVYPFIDPLHYLFPPVYVPFLGAPDLADDFYHGRALNRALFLREVYAEYHLYKVTGTKVRP